MGRKEEFIRKAKEKHGDKYSYPNINYINRFTEIEIICNKCGEHFKVIPDNLLHGIVKCPHEIEIERVKIEYLIKILKITNKENFEKYEYKRILLDNNSYDLGIVLFKCKNIPIIMMNMVKAVYWIIY